MNNVQFEILKSIENLNVLVDVMNELISKLCVSSNENSSTLFTLIQGMEARAQDEFIDKFCFKLEICDAVSKIDPRFFECRKVILNIAKDLEVVANRAESLIVEILEELSGSENWAISDAKIVIIKSEICKTKAAIKKAKNRCLQLNLA